MDVLFSHNCSVTYTNVHTRMYTACYFQGCQIVLAVLGRLWNGSALICLNELSLCQLIIVNQFLQLWRVVFLKGQCWVLYCLPCTPSLSAQSFHSMVPNIISLLMIPSCTSQLPQNVFHVWLKKWKHVLRMSLNGCTETSWRWMTTKLKSFSQARNQNFLNLMYPLFLFVPVILLSPNPPATLVCNLIMFYQWMFTSVICVGVCTSSCEESKKSDHSCLPKPQTDFVFLSFCLIWTIATHSLLVFPRGGL